jgi:CheY-like chemotaxis protein
MDHMMPEMDGIETTALIREWENTQLEAGTRRKQIPIIALTANAVVGMREMFLQKGFDDFLTKPIDVSKLDDMLERWIPKEKREQGAGSRDSDPQSPFPTPCSQLPHIPGVDTAKGIAMTGGTEAGYRAVLSIFRKDAEDRLPLLQTAPETDALPAFITHVHALKSASASIGAAGVSALAAELETAGLAGDMAFIQENLFVFTERLKELIQNIYAVTEPPQDSEKTAPDNIKETDISAYIPDLQKLTEALQSQKVSEIKNILNLLDQQTRDSKLNKIVERISDQVLIAEFDGAIKTVEELLTGTIKE